MHCLEDNSCDCWPQTPAFIFYETNGLLPFLSFLSILPSVLPALFISMWFYKYPLSSLKHANNVIWTNTIHNACFPEKSFYFWTFTHPAGTHTTELKCRRPCFQWRANFWKHLDLVHELNPHIKFMETQLNADYSVWQRLDLSLNISEIGFFFFFNFMDWYYIWSSSSSLLW